MVEKTSLTKGNVAGSAEVLFMRDEKVLGTAQHDPR